MYTPRPPPGRKGDNDDNETRHAPKPPTAPKAKPPPPSNPPPNQDSDSDDGFDADRQRGKQLKGNSRKPPPPTTPRKGSTSSSDDEDLFDRKKPKAVADEDFTMERKRVNLKNGYVPKEYQKKVDKINKVEVPCKANNYLNRTMSDVIRGDDPQLPDLEDLLYDHEHKQYEEMEGATFWEKMQITYNKKIHEKKFCPRAVLCALAVSLLWASSVSACKLIVRSFIPSPSYSEVEDQVNLLSTTMIQFQSDYENCVDAEVEICNSTYLTARDAEIARWQAIQLQNQETLVSDEAIKNGCANNYDIMLSKLSEYASAGLFISDHTASNPPSGITCDDIQALSTTELNSALALNVSRDSSKAAISTIDDYQNGLNEQEAYDDEFQANVTSAFDARAAALRAQMYNSSDIRNEQLQTLGEMQACLGNGTYDLVTITTVNVSITDVNGNPGFELQNKTTTQHFVCSGTSLGSFTNEYFGNVGSDYAAAQEQAQAYINQFQAYQADVARIQSIVSGVPDFVFDFNMPSVDLSGMQADFFSGLNGLGISEEQFTDLMNSATQAYNGNFDDANAQLDALQAQVDAQQQAYLDSLETDYNPPFSGDAQASADQAKANAGALSEKIADDLGGVNVDTGNIPNISNVSSSAGQQAAQLIGGLANRSIEFYAYPSSIFASVSANLSLVLNLVLIFDTIWRVLKSVFLVKKYWGISAVATPPADIRTDKGMLFKEKKNSLQKVGTILASPLVFMICSLFTILLLSILFYVAYIPIFNEYVDGCSKHNATQIEEGESSGTMIYRNLLTLTQQFVDSKGDSAIASKVDKLNLERSLGCRDYFDESSNGRINQNNTFVDLKSEMDLVNQKYNLFAGCVNWAEFDQATASFSSVESLLDTAGFTFDQGWNNESCLVPFATIDVSDDALHQCADVPACEPDCEPPKSSIMLNVNHQVACVSEYAVHSYFLTGLFATTMFICLNLSRQYLLNGIVEVGWPTICLELHSYIVSCTERGTIMPPEEVEKGEASFQEVIKVALDKSLHKFTTKGYYSLAYAILMNLPWIVFMTVISKQVNYNELKSSS